MTPEAFDDVVADFDTALVVATTASGDQRAGCVVGFHTQCSIDPPRYAVFLSKANLTHRVALFATHVAVHALDVADHDLAELFGGTTGDEVEKFARCDWTPGPGGAPLITRCRSRIVLERVSLWDDGSDHVCFVGAPVTATRHEQFDPLRLSAAADISAGHEAEERDAPAELDAEAGRRGPTDVS